MRSLSPAVTGEQPLIRYQMLASGRCRRLGEGQAFQTGCWLVSREPLGIRLDIDEMVADGDVVQQELGATITMRVH